MIHTEDVHCAHSQHNHDAAACRGSTIHLARCCQSPNQGVNTVQRPAERHIMDC